jgi:hypothetical protein
LLPAAGENLEWLAATAGYMHKNIDKSYSGFTVDELHQIYIPLTTVPIKTTKETLSKRMASTTMLQTYSCPRIATRFMDYYSNSMDMLEVCYSNLRDLQTYITRFVTGPCTNGINGNVGIAACMIVEGMGGVGDAPFHARIAAMSARGRIVVLGEIVERGGNYVQGCPSQHKCKKSYV